jgi:hypothetical protein
MRGAQPACQEYVIGRASYAAIGIAAGAGALATIIVLYPGQYPFDAAAQLWQARTGDFGNGSPVAMIAAWSLLLRAFGNPAALLCVNVVALWAGLALCTLASGASIRVSVVVLLLIGLSPLALVEMAHVLTDAHLAAVLVVATGCCAYAKAAGRRVPLAGAAALFVYAGCVRHNAVIAILPFGALVMPALRRIDVPRREARFIGAVALGAASIALALLLDRALVRAPVHVWPTLALWDLAAMSVDRDVMLLPPFTHGPGLSVQELRDTGAYDPTTNTFLFERSRSGVRDGYGYPYSSEEQRGLATAWANAVWHYPVAYLRHRLHVFGLLIGAHRDPVHGIAYFELRLPFRDNPPLPAPLVPGAQAALYRLAAALAPTWVFAGLPYLLLAALAGAIGSRRRDDSARIAVAISASALLYALAFFPLAPSADLRYLTWPIVAGPLALAFALLPEVHRAQRGRR